MPQAGWFDGYPLCFPTDTVCLCRGASMRDLSGTNQELIEEISVLKQRIQELEQWEPKCRQMEIELHNSEEKYRSLASAADWSFVVDRDCRYLFANENYLNSYGLTRDSLLGRKYDEFHDEEQARIFADAVHYVFETGNINQREHRGERSDSYFLQKLSPVRDIEGSVTAVTVIAIDITGRKHAEEKLQQTLEILRKAVGTTIQAMVSAVEARDPYTAGHQLRSADLARAIATEMELPHEYIDCIRLASYIH